ncbi:MAG TPA: GspH/FimT family pseudopilin [Patescibacteria group bacterium]
MANLKRLSSKKDGYTLIEILVVLVIMGILFAVGYANYRDFSRQQLVINAMRTLRADLRLAQEQAIEGKKPTGCTGNLSGYKFTVLNPALYQISAACGSGDVVVKTVDVPAGITISTPSLNPIVFNILGTGTNINQASPSRAVIGLTQTATNYFRSIIVYPSGEVKESTETPDPVATPTPTPTPPPGSWHALGTWTFGCGTVVAVFPTKTASSILFTKVSGGGGDGMISYQCYGSNGMQVQTGGLFGGTWQIAPGPCGWLNGQSTTISFAETTVGQFKGAIGCNDGETAGVSISYYGP